VFLLADLTTKRYLYWTVIFVA